MKFEFEGSPEELKVFIEMLRGYGFAPAPAMVPPSASAPTIPAEPGVVRFMRPTDQTDSTISPDSDLWKSRSAGPGHLDDHSEPPTSDPSPDHPPVRVTPSPHPELVRAGCDIWYGILDRWLVNFDAEGEQHDRAKILLDTFSESSTEILAFLRYCGGLTRLVLTLKPELPKKRIRHLAENIAQVSSALGLPGISDQLEYTREYIRMAKGD